MRRGILDRLIPFIGLLVMLFVCYVLSNNRSKVNWRLVGWGLALQFIFALLILKTVPGRAVFEGANTAVQYVLNASNEGTRFVFGSWGNIHHDANNANAIAIQHRFNNFYKENFRMATLGGVHFYVAGNAKGKILAPIFGENGEVKEKKEIQSEQDVRAYLASNQAILDEKVSASTQLVLLLDGFSEGANGPEATAKKLEVPVIDQNEFQRLLNGLGANLGSNFVFFPQVMGTIILVSTLMAILFYFGIMQRIVQCIAWVMMKTMGTSGAESLASAANVFVGQTEAPIVIGPYLKTMTKAELLSLMVGGLATIAGGVMIAYVSFGVSAGHLLAASVMSAPAALLVAKILCPETTEPVTRGKVKLDIVVEEGNVIEAAARGCSDGLKLSLNVMAMLIGFIAVVKVLNILLGFVPSPDGGYLSFEKIMAWLFYPFAWLMGVVGKDTTNVAQLLGVKIVLNEFIAYLSMAQMRETMDPKNFIIATYALCGFANFSSIGIQIGGISALAENRRSELASLGIRALIGGTVACYMTACIAGILVDPAEAFYDRGNERLVRGNLVGSIEDFSSAIKLNPDYSEAYKGRGDAKQKSENLEEAIADFSEAIRIQPKFAEAFNARGFTHAKKGNFKDAIADLNEALTLKPEYLEALYNRGLTQFNGGNKEESKKDLKQYLEKTRKKKDLETKQNRENALKLFPEFESFKDLQSVDVD